MCLPVLSSHAVCIRLQGVDLLAKTGEIRREFSTVSAPLPTQKAAMAVPRKISIIYATMFQHVYVTVNSILVSGTITFQHVLFPTINNNCKF